ncbi:MAG: hypothetical protein AB7N65_05125 [Vicinamibacterales bacterium]
MVDATGAPVGSLLDAYNGFVLRQVGTDRLMLQVTAAGVMPASISFLHTSPDCTGIRYVNNQNGSGLTWYAQAVGSQLVYTRLVDPTFTVAVQPRAIEMMAPNQDLMLPGRCIPLPESTPPQSMGEAVIAVDGGLASLVPPLHVE